MRLLRVINPDMFDNIPEDGMDFHMATAETGKISAYIIIGGRVAISLEEPRQGPIEGYLNQHWLLPDLSREEREESFNGWLSELPAAPPLSAERTRGYGAPLILRIADGAEVKEGQEVFAFIVSPLGPLSPPPPRPASIYGHLPFGTMTDSSTVIHRWEAFPSSRRITRTPSGGSIARDTYAAPASESAFAVTGFAAVARFALPNLLPACFRWELQPVPSVIECGASVPLHGQSGGGVEVRFPRATNNRCPIANPVLLPSM
jgi:hypothetical protein